MQITDEEFASVMIANSCMCNHGKRNERCLFRCMQMEQMNYAM